MYAVRSWLAVEHLREQNLASRRMALKELPHLTQTQIGLGLALDGRVARLSARMHARLQNFFLLGSLVTTNMVPHCAQHTDLGPARDRWRMSMP
jgi:hypothetical protein